MAATTFVNPGQGTEVHRGHSNSVVTLNETNQLSTRPGRLCRVYWFSAGTAWRVQIFDHGSSNSNPIYDETSPAAQTMRDLDFPIMSGVRVVTSGTTPGQVSVIWS